MSMQLQQTRYPEAEEVSSASPAGQVRVLVVGDSGVGKTSLVDLITHGRPSKNPPRTVGCNVSIKYIDFASEGPDSVHSNTSATRFDRQNLRGRPLNHGPNSRRGYFVELWDVSGHENYQSSRSIYYSQINGVIFVHDMSRRKTRMSALRWLAEVAKHGTFSSPSMPRRPGMLPVPLLVIGNKGDIREIDPLHRSATKLWEMVQGSPSIRAAQSWAEKQQWLGFGMTRNADLPDYIRNPHSSGIVACAKEGKLDMRAVTKFFVDLIERRYYMEHMAPLPSPSRSWINPYFNSLSNTSSGSSTPASDAGSSYALLHGLHPAYGGFDPMLSTVYGARSKLVQLQDSTGTGNSYEWASDHDQLSIRVDDDLSMRSKSEASLYTENVANGSGTSVMGPGEPVLGSGIVVDAEECSVNIDGAPVAWSREEIGHSEESLGLKSSWSSFSAAQEAAAGVQCPSNFPSLRVTLTAEVHGSTVESWSRLVTNTEEQSREWCSAAMEPVKTLERESRPEEGSPLELRGSQETNVTTGCALNLDAEQCSECCDRKESGHEVPYGTDDGSWLPRQQQGMKCPAAYRHDKHLHGRMAGQGMVNAASPQRGRSPVRQHKLSFGEHWVGNGDAAKANSDDKGFTTFTGSKQSRGHKLLEIRA